MKTETASYQDLGYDKLLSRGDGGRSFDWRAIPIGAISIRAVQFMVNPVTDIQFTASDADTVAWTTGTIYFANGSDSGTIASGDTGNMGASNYFIYYDRTKISALQITTSVALATGPDKICLAKIYGGDSSTLVVLI